jgi:hypothetical protein
MFEDFRKQAEQAEFPEEDQEAEQRVEPPKNTAGRFLGMTAFQRFIVASMLLLMTIVLGALFLVVTSKVALPFLG